MAGDLDYIGDVAIAQVDAGTQILDVNVGYPGVDEVAMLPRVVKKLPEAVDVPLQLDSPTPPRWKPLCASIMAKRRSTPSTAKRKRCKRCCRW